MSGADANVGDRGHAGQIGRKLGIWLFWLLAVYMVGMSAASIIPALYWPNAAPRPKAAAAARCAEEIATLERDLLDTAAGTLRRGEVDGLERSLLAWDQRSIALSGGCGPLEPARKDLLALRARVGALLTGYRGRTLRLQQRLRRALDAFSVGATDRPKT